MNTNIQEPAIIETGVDGNNSILIDKDDYVSEKDNSLWEGVTVGSQWRYEGINTQHFTNGCFYELIFVSPLHGEISIIDDGGYKYLYRIEEFRNTFDKLGKSFSVKKQQIKEIQDPEHDPVNKPKHYALDKIECIDVILQNSQYLPGRQAALYGAIQKYIWRYHHKENPLQDLKKARWYLDKLIEIVGEKDE